MSGSIGYSDTPILPDSGFHVHDGTRPQPRLVDAGVPGSQEQAGKAPSEAVVLFDGTSLSQWRGKSGEAQWKVENGYMEVVSGTGDITSVPVFGDIHLHVEWAAPAVVKGDSQGRGNSGVFLADRYEIQVLDCYNNPTYADGTTGAIYGQYPPAVNACRMPGMWQTYDILWEAPRFEGERLLTPAIATVLHNGVVLHYRRPLLGPTGHRNMPAWTPHGDAPIRLQDHGDLVRFRNIWVRPLQS